MPNASSDPSFAQPARIEVIEAVGAATTFSLYYDFHIEDGDYKLLKEARLDPEAEIAIRVRDGDASAVLVRGPVTRQRMSITDGGSGSVLEVTGADMTISLGREVKVSVWPTTTDASAITQLLGGAPLTPQITLPTTVTHDDTKHALIQRETDLQLIRRLARRNGCWLWLEYDPMAATATAHVERPPVDGAGDITLNLSGSDRNIDELVIEWDVEQVVSADADARDTFGATDVSGTTERSPLTTLGDLALADIVTSPRRARLTAPADDAGDLAARSEGALIEDGWFVRATLTARQRVLKRVLRAPSVVTLKGVGSRHSGKYLVARVVHRIDDEDHRMEVTLMRNGWNA